MIKKFLHIQDEPNSPLGREWRRWPTISFGVKTIFSLELQLIRWLGEPQIPRPVSGCYFIINLNPTEWKIESSHIYYNRAKRKPIDLTMGMNFG